MKWRIVIEHGFCVSSWLRIVAFTLFLLLLKNHFRLFQQKLDYNTDIFRSSTRFCFSLPLDFLSVLFTQHEHNNFESWRQTRTHVRELSTKLSTSSCSNLKWLNTTNTTNISLLESGDFSDLTITCQGNTFNVHKSVVCFQSRFFSNAVKQGAFKVSMEVQSLETRAATDFLTGGRDRSSRLA